jgi:hypothetical protein
MYLIHPSFYIHKMEKRKLKEKICDSLNGKKYEIVWSEQVQYSTCIMANDEQDASDKFMNGDYPEPSINDTETIDDSLEIIEIPEEEWKHE